MSFGLCFLSPLICIMLNERWMKKYIFVIFLFVGKTKNLFALERPKEGQQLIFVSVFQLLPQEIVCSS